MDGCVRELTQQDLPRIRAVVAQHTLPTYAEETTDYVRQHLGDEQHEFLVYEDAAGVVQAFATGVIYPEDVDPATIAITHPTAISYPDARLLLLKHNYVDTQYQGTGIGTRLVKERIRLGVEHHGITAVVCEAWVKARYKSSDELLEKLGFECAYHSTQYYAEYNEENTGLCAGCDQLLAGCECAGAIYIHRNPAALVE